jgi:hypothetical protein
MTSPRSTIGTPSIECTSHARIAERIGRGSCCALVMSTGRLRATISWVKRSASVPQVSR